jgi:sugar phosphate isomerase/epimerase
MKIQFFCPKWGSDQLSVPELLQKAKDAGYDGVEYAVRRGHSQTELQSLFAAAEELGMLLIAQHYDTVEADFELHEQLYKDWFEKIKPFPFAKINSQTGRDFFSFAQNSRLINIAAEYEAKSGIPVIHETHRGKFSFASHITKDYLLKKPNLRLTLDLSHWVNVAESWLDDQAATVELAISRTDHIHARVGHTQGPQVPDPRAPEWQEALERHLAWWDEIVKQHKENNTDLTITPEFGPYPYLIEMPYNRRPLAIQWDVNVWMLNLLKERYA